MCSVCTTCRQAHQGRHKMNELSVMKINIKLVDRRIFKKTLSSVVNHLSKLFLAYLSFSLLWIGCCSFKKSLGWESNSQRSVSCVPCSCIGKMLFLCIVGMWDECVQLRSHIQAVVFAVISESVTKYREYANGLIFTCLLDTSDLQGVLCFRSHHVCLVIVRCGLLQRCVGLVCVSIALSLFSSSLPMICLTAFVGSLISCSRVSTSVS